MASVDPLESLRQEAIGPLYWIFGKERYLVDRALGIIKERALEPATRDFNYDLFYGKEAGAQKILAAARTLPMMAKRRLVIVRDADGLDAEQLQALTPFVAKPSPETCLVFIADKADMRLKFFTTFKKRGTLIKLEPMQDRQLPSFLRGEARERGLRLDADAAEMIADEVGADLGQLIDALERLELYVGARKQVAVADVEAVVATTRQRSVFELCDAVGGGDAARALTALGSLFGAREPALRILALIGRTVRQLLVLRELLDRRAPRHEQAEKLGVPPFVLDKLEPQARRLDGAALRAMHAAVYRADRTLKSSKVDDERVMELLVLELTRVGPRPSRGRV